MGKIISSDEDLIKWIDFEQPFEFFNIEDKEKIRRIGTSLNNCLRNGTNLESDEAFNIFKRLINSKKLKENLIVFRGQKTIEYEKALAKKHGMKNEYLYYDGFVYTSLYEENYYYHDNVRIKIHIPAGTNYIFTGEYSNTPGSNELILDVGTVLKIIKKKQNREIIYIDAVVENNVHNSIE